MTHVSSRPALAFDSSSADFLHAAGDIGEVIAILAGGARPDPEKIARLSVSLRGVQTYLIDGGRERSRFESVDDAPFSALTRDLDTACDDDDFFTELAKAVERGNAVALQRVREALNVPA